MYDSLQQIREMQIISLQVQESKYAQEEQSGGEGLVEVVVDVYFLILRNNVNVPERTQRLTLGFSYHVVVISGVPVFVNIATTRSEVKKLSEPKDDDYRHSVGAFQYSVFYASVRVIILANAIP